MNLLSNVFDPRTLIGALSLGVVILIFAVIAGRLVRAWYQRVGSHGHLFIDRTTAHFAEQLLQLASLLIAATLYAHLVPALHKLGTALLASASIESLVLGLAARNVLGQLIAGITLLLYRPLEIGDVLVFNAPTGMRQPAKKRERLRNLRLGTQSV
jgi:small-conductance mechanosensitive channel